MSSHKEIFGKSHQWGEIFLWNCPRVRLFPSISSCKTAILSTKIEECARKKWPNSNCVMTARTKRKQKINYHEMFSFYSIQQLHQQHDLVMMDGGRESQVYVAKFTSSPVWLCGQLLLPQRLLNILQICNKEKYVNKIINIAQKRKCSNKKKSILLLIFIKSYKFGTW